MNTVLASFFVPTAEELTWFSPEFAMVGTLVAILIAALAVGRSPRTTLAVVLVGIAGTLLCACSVAGRVADGGRSGLAPASAAGMLIVDNLTVYFKIILMLFAAGVTALWWFGGGRNEKNAPEFFTLLLGSALGMSLMVSTLNLLLMVLAIEFASLPSYAMVGFNKRDKLAAEASLKYLLFGAITFAIMAYGTSLLYGAYQTLDLGAIAPAVLEDIAGGRNKVLLTVALVTVLAGIGFKISAVPFHFWTPDAFQGARIEVTTWLSVVSKAAGLLLVLRLVHVFGAAAGPARLERPPTEVLAWTLGVLAMITCTVGNLSAYQQTSVKRLLAYSSIAHAGYMLMAAAVFVHPASGATNQALSAVLFYVVVYLFMNLGAFGVTAMVALASGDDSIDSFTGLVRRSAWLAVPMLFCLVSLVGLPPFGGFIAKYWLLYALAAQGGVLQWILIIVAVLNTLLSLFYYMRIVKQMMLRDDGRPALDAPAGGMALVNLCAVTLILLGLFVIQPVKDRTDRFASNLFRASVGAVSDRETAEGGMLKSAAADAGMSDLPSAQNGSQRTSGLGHALPGAFGNPQSAIRNPQSSGG